MKKPWMLEELLGVLRDCDRIGLDSYLSWKKGVREVAWAELETGDNRELVGLADDTHQQSRFAPLSTHMVEKLRKTGRAPSHV